MRESDLCVRDAYRWFLADCRLMLVDRFKCCVSNVGLGPFSVYPVQHKWLRKYGLFNEKHTGIFRCLRKQSKT